MSVSITRQDMRPTTLATQLRHVPSHQPIEEHFMLLMVTRLHRVTSLHEHLGVEIGPADAGPASSTAQAAHLVVLLIHGEVESEVVIWLLLLLQCGVVICVVMWCGGVVQWLWSTCGYAACQTAMD